LSKAIDKASAYGINCSSAIKITQTVEYAQYATGGRLGVRLCQM